MSSAAPNSGHFDGPETNQLMEIKMTGTTSATAPDASHRTPHPDVTVNNHRVVLTEHRMTGMAIKQAAIAQGAELELDFALSVKNGKRFKPVADDKEIKIHDDDEFIAVAQDDNS